MKEEEVRLGEKIIIIFPQKYIELKNVCVCIYI